MIHKTRMAAATTVALAALVLTACAPSSDLAGDDSTGDGPSGSTYSVGVLAPMTSWAGAIGVDMQQGWDMYWNENDNTAGDYTIETNWQDTASDPDTALTKAHLLVEEDKVDLVVGPLLASEGLVVGDYLSQEGVANLAQTAADDLTQRLASPLVVRTGSYTGSQMTYPAGAWAAEEGYTTAATLCVDYAFGWESCGGFVSAFTDAGGTVSTQLWYPGDASDLSSYVSQLASLDVDVIFIGSAGGTDSSNFLRSASDFGLLAKTPIINNCCTTDQAILQDVGDIALGQLSVSNWAEGNDDPTVADFVAKYEEAYGVLPSSYAYGMYASAQMLAQAIESSDTKLAGEDLVDAVKAVDLSTTIIGGGSLDEYGNIVGPVFLREVVAREDGTLWNTVVKTYDDVSQFWTFDADSYLANPSFNQEFQTQ
jgi:branched-chain amino acid transport system substrate-binding protein